jgi:hypothetical protein
MQGLAIDSNTKTEDVALALQAMSVATSDVSGSSATASSTDSNANEITRQMGKAALELHSSSESAFQRVNEIAALGTETAGKDRRGSRRFLSGEAV